MQWPYRSASNTYDEKTPICKDFTNGACNRGSNCKYRHISQQMQESVNQALYSQPNVQETGFVNKNMPSGHFNPSMFSISNPDNSSHFRQSSFINNAVIVSPTDSLLNPVSSGYIPGGSSHSLVGLIGNTSTGQPTLYTAHSSLVSLTSARHITPCSSVLTVGADPIHHPNVIHPQTGLSAHHATYHIVPHDASPHHHHHHHHLLATSSSHSHAPTLLTIPLSQFTCNVSNNSLIQSQAAIACSTQHHAVVTGVLPAHPSISTAPAAYFPSYGVFQINQPTLETCDQQVKTEIHKQVHETKQSTCSTAAPATTTTTPVVTSATTAATSVSSSTTAVLAAAAAAGYIAQHLPVIGSNNLSGSSNISQEHNNNLILNPSKGVNVHESAIAAAANLPTVSAAAAAAVAAAAAFACSTSISQNSKCCALLSNVQTKLNEIDPESGSFAFLPHNNANNNNNAAAAASNNNNNDNSNYNNVNNSTTLNNVESFSCQDPTYLSTNIKSDNDDPTTNTKTMITNNYNFQNRLTRESSYTLDNANTNNNNNNNMNSNCEKSTSSFDSLSNSTPSSSEYLNPTDEEQAKTAAAVAAAACIGAIFSQPMAAVAAAASGGGVGGGVGSNVAKNSAPSSVAAMLVENLIGCNQQDFIYAVQSSTSSLSSSYGSSLLSKSSRQINNKCNTNSTSSCHSQQQMKKQCHMTTEKSTNDQSEHSGAEGGRGIGNANHHSTNYHSIQSNTVNNSPQTSSSSDRCKCSNPLLDSQYSLQDAITSDAANWSSVTTTMASAAKAVAAAAAVAATAAVTGSANFFRLTQFKNKMNSQLERIPYSSTTSSYPSTSNVYSSLHCNDDQFKNSQLNTEKLSSTSIDKTQLNTDLSTKKAVTMTSAAAAAAMVAAAATVAAEQHQLIGKSFLSEVTYSNKSEKQPTRRVINGNSRLLNTNCNYHRTYSSSSASASHNDFNSPLSSYKTDNRMYHLTHESNQYPPMKRHKSKRMTPIDCHYTDYSNLHHHSNLRESVDDYEDDDADVYEDDDIESTTLMSPSPEVTPPYNLSKKLSKCKKLLNFSSYPHQIDDDSRLVSCETSPNPWRSTNCNIILHRTINNHLSNTIFHCLRRSLSTSSIPSKSTYGIILKMRSKSFPVIQSHCQKDEKRSLFTYLLKDNNHKYNSMDNYQTSNSSQSSSVPFSIAQAAAAVVAAAAQNQTNPSVYVSSPTSVNNQQNSATISALGDGSDGGDGFSLHSLFPKIASANTISTDGITIPSNQTLTAVQIQSTPQLPQATALIQHHHPQALNSQQQTGISNYYQHQMNHSIDTLAASIGNTSVSPTQQNNISQSSSTFQVCHNPIVSIANVFPKLSHDASSENAKLIPIGVPNTLTVVLDENTPQTPTYTIPSSVSSHSSVSLQIPVTVGAHLTPIVSCSSHQDPTKLVVSVTYPNQDVAAVAAAAAVTAVNVIPSTTSTQHTSSNRINTQTCVIPNHQIQIVHKLTSGHQTTCKK
ncbi:unnamed protein product [Heterobilharzia americana]|nr:unnamed protein product [Heterobilharzia americana]